MALHPVLTQGGFSDVCKVPSSHQTMLGTSQAPTAILCIGILSNVFVFLQPPLGLFVHTWHQGSLLQMILLPLLILQWLQWPRPNWTGSSNGPDPSS